MDLSIIWPLAAAFTGILLAAGELIAPARGGARRRQNIRAFVLLALSLVVVHGTLLLSGLIREYAWFFGWQSPGGYIAAPLLYYYIRLNLDPLDDALSLPRTWLIILGPGACVAGHAFWQMIGGPPALERIAAFYAGRGGEHWIILLGFAYFFTYMLAAAMRVLRRLAPATRPAHVGLAAAAWGTAVSGLGFVAMISGTAVLLQWTVYSMAAFVPAIYLVARRSPDMLAEWLERIDRQAGDGQGAGGESRLGSVDLEDLSARLDALMNDDHFYLNEEIALGDLARAVDVTQHQLSEFLNRKRGTGFFHYINGFRVQAACRLLRDEPERTILAIAYDVGFNSKSAFHRAFSRHTGLSPREYRRAAEPGRDSSA